LQNLLVDLPDDLYRLIQEFLPRYVPDVAPYYNDNLGFCSYNLMSLNILNDIYTHHILNNMVSETYIRLYRTNYALAIYNHPSSAFFNDNPDTERFYFEAVYQGNVDRCILLRSIEQYKIDDSCEFDVQCLEVEELETFDLYYLFNPLPPVRQQYLDTLYFNTNDIDVVEVKYLAHLNNDYDQYEVQSKTLEFLHYCKALNTTIVGFFR
jgi:hypothetical protein